MEMGRAVTGGRLAGIVAALLAFIPLCSAPHAAAAGGRIHQFNGPFGCTTQTGAEGCATGRNLRGAAAATVSPDGRNVYVASHASSSVTTFVRARGGRIVQRRGLAGCVSETGSESCATGRGLGGAFSVAVSPDGQNVYVASLRSVAVFARNPDGGRLRQLPGAAGCLGGLATDGCAPARGIAGGSAVTVSPDGQHVYVAGFASDAVAVFARDSGDGELSQLPGPAGCMSNSGAEGCSTGRGLRGAFSLAFDPSGTRLLVSSFNSHAVATLLRDTTGALTQIPGERGCVSLGGAEGCGPARGLENPNGVAVAPDGQSVYVASSGSDAVADLRLLPDGSLEQRAGMRGCTSLGGREGCASSNSLGGAFDVAVSPDGQNVYVASQREVTTFNRRNGSLVQIDCVSHRGVGNCATVRALDGATSVVLAPNGRHAYVTAETSASVSSFARDPRRGKVRVRLRNLPSRCVRRTFRARAAVKSLLPLRRVAVFLDGRRVGTSRQMRFRVRIRPALLRRGKHRLAVKAVDVSGTAGRRAARFRRC